MEAPGMNELRKWADVIDTLKEAHAVAEGVKVTTDAHLEQAMEEHQSAVDALGIAQDIAGRLQQKVHDQIAGIVSLCLQSVFENPYCIQVNFDTAGNKTQVRLSFEKNGEEIDPLTASGGGVVDVAAFALRLACLVLSKPPARRLLILDEPFKFLSVEYHERIGELLQRLSTDMGVQIIMVTHLPALQIGNVVSL